VTDASSVTKECKEGNDRFNGKIEKVTVELKYSSQEVIASAVTAFELLQRATSFSPRY
jgi:hypothetical protein